MNARKIRIAFYKKVVNRYKMLKGCQGDDCHYNNHNIPFIPEILHFDHIDRSKKVKGISHMIHGNMNFKKIKNEIRKCQVLCANCHIVKTLENKETVNKRYGGK